jgi:hypothetical protein
VSAGSVSLNPFQLIEAQSRMVQEQTMNPNGAMLRGRYYLAWDLVAGMTLLLYVALLPQFSAWRYFETTPAEGLTPAESPPLSSKDAIAYLGRGASMWFTRKRLRDSAMGDTKAQVSKLPDHYSPLLENLHNFETSLCRDARDRIYAILSISSDVFELGIEPDYDPTNTITRLYHDVSVRTLERTLTDEALDLYLRRVCILDNKSNPHLPSWALHVPRRNDLRPHEMDCFKRPHPYDRNMRPLIQFSAGRSILKLRGRKIDRISFCHPPVYDTRNSQFLNTERTKALLLIFNSVLGRQKFSSKDVASFCRVLLDIPSDHDWSTRDEGIIFACWSRYRWFLDTIPVEEREDRFFQFLRKLFPLAFPSADVNTFDMLQPINDDEFETSDRVKSVNCWAGRTFGMTKKNHYFSAMNELIEGDVVVALQSTGHLWVLRPVGKRYCLIGEAIVDGLMKGEAYEGLDPEEVDCDIEII